MIAPSTPSIRLWRSVYAQAVLDRAAGRMSDHDIDAWARDPRSTLPLCAAACGISIDLAERLLRAAKGRRVSRLLRVWLDSDCAFGRELRPRAMQRRTIARR